MQSWLAKPLLRLVDPGNRIWKGGLFTDGVLKRYLGTMAMEISVSKAEAGQHVSRSKA